MAKPILIIAVPYDAKLKSDLDHQLYQLEKKISDYHIIAYRANNILELQFTVLNADNANELDIEELKKEINSKIIK